MDTLMGLVVFMLAGASCWVHGFLSGLRTGAVLDTALDKWMMRWANRALQSPAKEKPQRSGVRVPDEEQLRQAEERARLDALLGNIEAFGTDKPQKEIRERSDI